MKFKQNGSSVFIDEIGIKKEGNENRYKEIMKCPEYILGEFDQDGYVLSNSESIYDITTIDKEHFLPRKRFKLNLVSVYGCVGVKKDYRGDKISFLNELKIYTKLLGKNISIPTILDVNFEQLSITFSYINGPTIREKLSNIGAVIIDQDLENNPELYKISPKNRWKIQGPNKSESLYSIIDSKFTENLFDEIKKIHNCDIYICLFKYGNIIIEKKSNKPYLIDFHESLDISIFGKYIKMIPKDCDIQKFNSLFFTQK